MSDAEEHVTSRSESTHEMSKTGSDGNSICVVGLGYVGLPLAVGFDQVGFDVTGYDVDPEQVDQIDSGTDPTGELEDEVIQACNLEVTTDPARIANSEYVIVAVPTPVDDLKNPNLQYVESAGETIGQYLQESAIVVLESTVYPGATREILASAVEETSGMVVGEDFYVGYSPERMVPGDGEHGLRNVVKIVSGQNKAVLENVAQLYETVIDAGVHRAPSIEVAEAAKCIENIQRDINIALMNELAIACDNLGLDTQAVLDAAGTKWNFHEYRPGLVGGHCIPVDPFFMIYESERNGFTPQLIEMSREVNQYMPEHVAEMTLKGLNDCGKVLRDSTVLVLGLTYKTGVGDIRTSIVGDVMDKLEDYGVDIIGVDPLADSEEASAEFGISVEKRPKFDGVDGVILATPHESLRTIDFVDAAERMAENPLMIDVDGVLDRERMEAGPLTYNRI